jgi:predicted aconitase
MILSEEERAMVAGERGEAVRRSLESQIELGRFFAAERFVPITNAHVMAEWGVTGEAGCAYVGRLLADDGRVAVPTTRNPGAVDVDHAERLLQSPALREGERRLTRLLRQLGVAAVDTCIGYQTVYQPLLGEHVAWGDTGAVIVANSVFGACTNYESGPAALAAALTGPTPAYGFHLAEHRRANVRCRLETELRDLSDWGALGAVLGARLVDYWSVPVIEDVVPAPTPDALKHLGASLASYGSLAMFHIAGVTPEAPTVAAAMDGRELALDLTISRALLDEVYESAGMPGDPVDLVVFSAPQLSLLELARVAALFDGTRVADGVTLIVTTNAATRAAAEREGYVWMIEAAGGLVLQGTCWYVMDPGAMREAFGWHRLVTNSTKLVNIVKSSRYDAVLRTTEACVEAAVTGLVPAR